MVGLNTKLRDHTGIGIRSGPRVGIELEYENCGRIRDHWDRQYWSMVHDPSLRNRGMEFVSGVLKPKDLYAAYNEVKRYIEEGHVSATKRCGVHVHLNASDLTYREVWNLLTLYALMEPTIFKQFADGREMSHFCVPMWANTHWVLGLADDVRRLRSPRAGHNQFNVHRCNKYSAINTAPLTILGSIEFRQHPATKDMRRVHKWISLLLRIRSQALTYADPIDIIEEYDNRGRHNMCDKIGLDTCDVLKDDQEEAEDAAVIVAGYNPPQWQELEWEIN